MKSLISSVLIVLVSASALAMGGAPKPLKPAPATPTAPATPVAPAPTVGTTPKPAPAPVVLPPPNPSSVGDTVTYEEYVVPAPGSINKQPVGLIETLTVVSLDATNTNYNIKDSLYLPDGSQQDHSQPTPVSSFQTRATIQRALLNCAAVGGVKEHISVSGGDFDTCALDDGKGGKIWIGDVPFNVVKRILVDESKNTINIEVSLYSYGK
jgi:putative hemolysin